MTSRYLFLALASCAVLGCSHRHSAANQPNQTVVAAATSSHPTECALDEQRYLQDSNLVSNPLVSVSLERDFQNIVHVDCRGNTVSSKIGTVKSPTATIKFRPSQAISAAGAVRLFNATECDWSSTKLENEFSFFYLTDRVRGKTDGELEITVDAAPGASSFHVKPGVNSVFYTYYTQCVPNEFRHDAFYEECSETREISSGSLQLNVEYAEKTLPGDKIVKDGCPSSSGSN